jgi:hypothetical protein
MRGAFAAMLLLAGCPSAVLTQRAPVPGADDEAWGKVRDAASRRADLYDGFVHRATASATWLSPPVREAAVRRLAEWQGLGPAETEKALEASRQQVALGEEFMLAFYSADRRANFLDAKETVWHIELVAGDVRAPAIEVRELTSDATIKQLYPYVSPFDVVYRVRVKWSGPPLEGRPFALSVASGYGAVVLDFGPDGERPTRPRQAP